ncbi:hypothetical protein D918_09886 [Trichuris suis]|nr:hypothetical protein D918_09886 [Trichuris suis]
MNGITALGGVTVVSQRRVQFGLGSPAVCVAVDSQIRLDKRDLVAMYSPDTRSWTAAWKWSGGMEPGVLRNTTEEYSPAEGASALYEKELEKWIENGWLVPYGEDSEVERGTSAYVDDILVNEDVVPASRVEQHLVRYGLSCKSHERVTGGA